MAGHAAALRRPTPPPPALASRPCAGIIASMADELQRIIDTLSRARRVLIVTHVRPDGDAIGCCAAMAMGLETKGIEAEVVLLSQLPDKYAFAFKDNGVKWHDAEKGWPADLALERFDLLLVLDTGTWSQLPGLKERIEGWRRPTIVIDHHLTQEDWADIRLVDKEAAAAGEIVADLLEKWGVAWSRPIAEALYLAVASDTGWFQFSNTRPETMRLAARLMEAGVDTDRMYQALYQNERAARVGLMKRALGSLELLAGGRLAVMMVTRKDFEAAGADMTDTENLINVPLQVATVQVSIFVSESLDGSPVRVSLRSKGQVDVARFAQRFGGGGHARAAGLKLKGSLDEARGRVVAEMAKELAG
jgi:bifunctional oligoribonuclease and PAP phosphatase NrnA